MRIGKNSLSGLLFVSIVLLLNACNVVVVKHDPNGHPPPHTASSFAYWYYYPNSQVYYHITKHYYYYRDGQRWIKGTALPAGRVLNKGYRVRLQIAGTPYRQHAHHERLYPPRQLKSGQSNQQNKPEHANHGKGPNTGHQAEHANRGKGLDKGHQMEHANRGKGPEKLHQPEYARAKGHTALAKPNNGRFHGKPAKTTGAIAHGQGNPDKGGSQKAKRPMGQQQPRGLQAKSRHGQDTVQHPANGNVKAKTSVPRQQRVENTNHSRDAVTHKIAGKTKMNPTGAHQNAQAQAHGNKSAVDHEQSQKTAGMTSRRNKQQAAKQHKASGKKQEAEKKQADKKAVAKDKNEEKAEEVLAAKQEEGDSVEEKPGNGKGKGKGKGEQ